MAKRDREAPDEDDPYRIVATLMDALPSGSYLAVTHVSSDRMSPDTQAKITELTQQMSHQQYYYRGRPDVARFFGGLDLVEPGLVPLQDWRPEPGDQPVGSDVALVAGVARKP